MSSSDNTMFFIRATYTAIAVAALIFTERQQIIEIPESEAICTDNGKGRISVIRPGNDIPLMTSKDLHPAKDGSLRGTASDISGAFEFAVRDSAEGRVCEARGPYSHGYKDAFGATRGEGYGNTVFVYKMR